MTIIITWVLNCTDAVQSVIKNGYNFLRTVNPLQKGLKTKRRSSRTNGIFLSHFIVLISEHPQEWTQNTLQNEVRCRGDLLYCWFTTQYSLYSITVVLQHTNVMCRNQFHVRQIKCILSYLIYISRKCSALS